MEQPEEGSEQHRRREGEDRRAQEEGRRSQGRPGDLARTAWKPGVARESQGTARERPEQAGRRTGGGRSQGSPGAEQEKPECVLGRPRDLVQAACEAGGVRESQGSQGDQEEPGWRPGEARASHDEPWMRPRTFSDRTF